MSNSNKNASNRRILRSLWFSSAIVVSLAAMGFLWHRPELPAVADQPGHDVDKPSLPSEQALENSDPRERAKILTAMLRTWSSSDPGAAARWVIRQPGLETQALLDLIFEPLAQQPTQAVALANSLSEEYPAQARDFGYALITALNRAGAFAVGAQYAMEQPTNSFLRRDLVIASYHAWGQQQPEQGMAFAAQLTDPNLRELALQSVFSGWARKNPEELADASLGFPDGPEKEAALIRALRAWMVNDADKAGAWIERHRETLPAAEAAIRDD